MIGRHSRQFTPWRMSCFVAALLVSGGLGLNSAQAADAGADHEHGTLTNFLDKVNVYGDFRLRYENDWDSARASGAMRDDRGRARIRARIGATFDARPDLSFGVRVRTGSNRSQQSPHITIADFSGDSKGTKGASLDKWYAKYKREHSSLWIGRNGFPFWKQNELFWDDDVTPLGIAGRYSRDIHDGTLTVNGGYFTLPDGQTRFNGELAAGQFVYSKSVNNVKLTGAVGGFLFSGKDGAEYLRNGNSDRDYTIWVGNLQAKTDIAGIPVTFGADLLHNSEDYASTDPNSFTAANRDETDGFVGSIALGQLKNKGDWLVAYYYAYIEALAVNPSFAQDDWIRWGSSTQTDSSDLKGHEFRLAYALADSIRIVARLYLVEAITSAQDGNRFRLDYNWKF